MPVDRYVDVKVVTEPSYPTLNLTKLEDVLISLNMRLTNLEKEVSKIKESLVEKPKIDFI